MQQTQHSQLTIASAAHALRSPQRECQKAPYPGKSLPGNIPNLNICAAATKMKYDVRIPKAEKSRHLSVFFMADTKAGGLVRRSVPENGMTSFHA
jgi:hypothetical protein